MIEAVAVLGLAVWFALSVLNQFAHGDVLKGLHRFDPAGLLPNWTFFAPNPGVMDLELLVADQAADGQWSPWRRVVLGRRSRLRTLWNPRGRYEKLFADLSQGLMLSTECGTQGARVNQLGVPYIWLLWIAERQAADFRAERRRFAIVGATRHLDEVPVDLLFVSPPVDLRRRVT